MTPDATYVRTLHRDYYIPQTEIAMIIHELDTDDWIVVTKSGTEIIAVEQPEVCKYFTKVVQEDEG